MPNAPIVDISRDIIQQLIEGPWKHPPTEWVVPRAKLYLSYSVELNEVTKFAMTDSQFLRPTAGPLLLFLQQRLRATVLRRRLVLGGTLKRNPNLWIEEIEELMEEIS
jgi:hypothetical protein